MAKTILLADDSVTIQKVVELTFMDEDYEVVATGDGTSALEQLPEVRPDLVIADVHMPGADGYEVCRQTKESHPEIPVLLLVGTFEQFDEQKAASVRADGHLKKPFDSQDLLSQVDALVVGSGGSQAAEAVEATPSVGADVFGVVAEQPPVGDLEPPPLEASAPLAGDVWGAAPQAEATSPEPEASSFAPEPSSFAPEPSSFAPEPSSFAPEPSSFAPEPSSFAPAPEAPSPAPAPEASSFAPEPSSFAPTPEPSSFATAPTPDVATPLPIGDLDQDVTETAAVDINAIELDTPTPSTPDSGDAAFEAPAPIEDLEAPSLEAPPIEDFAPFAEEPVAEEPVVEEPVVEEPVASEPSPWATTESEASEVGVAEAVAAGDSAVEDTAAEDIVAPESVPEPEPAAAAPELAAAAAPAVAASTTAAANGSGPLSDDDVERIARRVAELVGEKALLNVAWEVLPDLAEVIIKERIRELESEVV